MQKCSPSIRQTQTNALDCQREKCDSSQNTFTLLQSPVAVCFTLFEYTQIFCVHTHIGWVLHCIKYEICMCILHILIPSLLHWPFKKSMWKSYLCVNVGVKERWGCSALSCTFQISPGWACRLFKWKQGAVGDSLSGGGVELWQGADGEVLSCRPDLLSLHFSLVIPQDAHTHTHPHTNTSLYTQTIRGS